MLFEFKFMVRGGWGTLSVSRAFLGPDSVFGAPEPSELPKPAAESGSRLLSVQFPSTSGCVCGCVSFLPFESPQSSVPRLLCVEFLLSALFVECPQLFPVCPAVSASLRLRTSDSQLVCSVKHSFRNTLPKPYSGFVQRSTLRSRDLRV